MIFAVKTLSFEKFDKKSGCLLYMGAYCIGVNTVTTLLCNMPYVNLVTEFVVSNNRRELSSAFDNWLHFHRVL